MAIGIPALNQEKQRRFQQAFDQHGRKWTFFLDIKSGGACTPFRPAFNAPWLPDQRCIKILRDRPGALDINYDEQILALKNAKAEYRQLMIRAANFFNVPNWNPDTDVPTAQMRNDIGEPPLPVEPVLAAKKGNGFVLGLRGFDPNKPGDVKLSEALVRWTAPPRGIDAIGNEGDEFADEPVDEIEEPTRGRKRSRQPVG